MSRYRVKNSEVQALRVQKGMDQDAPEWFYEAARTGLLKFKGLGPFLQDIPTAAIHCPSGSIVRAIEGDWIVRSESGAIAAWSPEKFKATFEKVIP